MKYGLRIPSFKKSLSAATKGAVKRSLMREIIPYYDKRGMGWSNPKRAVYNQLYSITTASPIDIVLDTSKSKRSSRTTTKNQQIDYDCKINALSVYKRGLNQCEIPMALNRYIKDDTLIDSPMHKAIRRLYSYVLGYMNKPMSCGYDYCDMCIERILKLRRINPEVKDICLNIVECISIGISADDIFTTLSSNKPLDALIKEHKSIENRIDKEASNKSIFNPQSQQYQQITKDLYTRGFVLRYIGLIVGFILFIWIIT